MQRTVFVFHPFCFYRFCFIAFFNRFCLYHFCLIAFVFIAFWLLCIFLFVFHVFYFYFFIFVLFVLLFPSHFLFLVKARFSPPHSWLLFVFSRFPFGPLRTVPLLPARRPRACLFFSCISTLPCRPPFASPPFRRYRLPSLPHPLLRFSVFRLSFYFSG